MDLSFSRFPSCERKPEERLTALLHHVDPDALNWAYHALTPHAAEGVNGQTWRAYGDGLEARLLDLHSRVHSGADRALASRRVEIPKPDGGILPLGVASLEDKIVRKAVAETILTPIFEPEFLGFSYGFRPGRSAHDAPDALAYCIERRTVNGIVDAEIANLFSTLDRGWLVKLLEHRIGDRRVIRLIQKWLAAGVMDGMERKDDLRGTPQGSVVSQSWQTFTYTTYWPLVRLEVARAAGTRRSGDCPLCRRFCGRIPTAG